MQRFAEKVIIITGAASGLGLATAQRLASECDFPLRTDPMGQF